MVRVALLGELLVESGGRPVQLSGSWHARSLLAWLALNPGEHRRAELAARFWPDVLDSSARASLRNGLWALRRALGPESAGALRATRERIELRTAADVWLDTAAFDDALAAGRLEAALALCRGELLAGLEEEWVHQYRDAHRARVGALLEQMARREQASGDSAGALAWTRRRVALDPLAEDAQRALISRLADAGDRPGALAAYGRLRERLRRELGVSVSQETSALALRVRESADAGENVLAGDQERPAAPRPPAGGADRAPGAPFPLPPRLRRRERAAFAGRVAELLQLRRSWSEASAGDGARVTLVVGEAGIGKTRLARELALEVHEAGAIVLHGAADEDLLVPHQHFVEALGHYVAAASATELRRHVEPRAADLAPILPSLGLAAVARGQPEGRRESRRYRLFAAVTSLLAALTVDAPVLLVLDDLQWADQSTAALLRHALQSSPEMRLLVLATQRPSDGPPAGALAEALQRLAQQGFVERVHLPGLLDADVAAMSQSLTGHPPSLELATAIREEAGGNPFFVQEIVRHLSDSERHGGARTLARSDVPEGVREVVDLRLARLSPACVRLLMVAAVVGFEFELQPLERVSDLEGEDLAAALDEALAADIVLEPPHGEREHFAFSHALVRRTLLARLTHAHRRRIHARVADALKVSRGDAALLEIAHHLCEALPAADRDEALQYATRAAEQAITGLAYAEAVDLFGRALSLLPRDDVRRRRLALHRALASQALFHAVMDDPRSSTRALAVTAAAGDAPVRGRPPPA